MSVEADSPTTGAEQPTTKPRRSARRTSAARKPAARRQRASSGRTHQVRYNGPAGSFTIDGHELKPGGEAAELSEEQVARVLAMSDHHFSID